MLTFIHADFPWSELGAGFALAVILCGVALCYLVWLALHEWVERLIRRGR